MIGCVCWRLMGVSFSHCGSDCDDVVMYCDASSFYQAISYQPFSHRPFLVRFHPCSTLS